MHVSRPWGKALVAVLAAVLLASVHLQSADAQGYVIPAADAGDVVYDDVRDLVYISSGTRLLRYDPVARVFLDPFDAPGFLVGLDISPDGGTLAAADSWSGPGGQLCIHRFDLDTGAVTSSSFAPLPGEVGTWSVAYGADGRLLVSSMTTNGWASVLRLHDPATGWTAFSDFRSKTALAATPDDSVVAFAEPGISDGRWGRYRVSDGDLVRRQFADGTSFMNDDVSISRDGSQYAIAVRASSPAASVVLFDADYQYDRRLSASFGAKYSPSQDLLYVPELSTGHIRALETSDYAEVASYDFETTFDWNWNAGLRATPRIAVPMTSSMLLSTVPGGVRCVYLKPWIGGSVVSSKAGAPIAGAMVELYRETGGTWSVEATTSTSDQGTWGYLSESGAGVRIRVTDPSGVHPDPVWIGGTKLEDAATFIPAIANGPQPQATMLRPTGSVAGTVTAAATGRALSGVRVMLYNTELKPVACAVTDGAGRFTFAGMDTGGYRVRFTHPRYRPVYYEDGATLQSADVVTVSRDEQTNVSQALTYKPHTSPYRR